MERTEKLVYCSKCGRIACLVLAAPHSKHCPICGYSVEYSSKNTDEFFEMSEQEKDRWEKKFLEKHVFNHPDFDKKLYLEYCTKDSPYSNFGYWCPDYRGTKPVVLDKEYYKNLAREEHNRNKPHCPMCNSINLTRISTAGRMVSVGLFGLASGSIGKNMKCRSCGYKW